ncbi:MAG TPA: dihydrodipicolinate synthase family protein [Solirubrobacteraceae bacterium]|jgi:4-hydroxy-tetrahydrodipicolinate synthase|nr:dihydrodipicolinate synthase family protein [Solirubrobacteraceae bacterium]
MAIEGILPVIPTPFREGQFDEGSFQRMLDHMLPWVDGYTLLGSTGEAPSLSNAERMRIAEFALHHTPSTKTVVVGVTHTSVNDSLQLAAHAQEHGAAAVLCASPYYFANTAGGIRRFLAELDSALAIELVLYDNPVSTGTKLQAEQVIAYAEELPRLNTVKLTDHELSKIAVWQQAGLKVLAGDDPILFRYLAAGVDGAMLIAPVLFPEPFRRVWDQVQAGEVLTALTTLGGELLPVLHVFGIGDEIATSKHLLTQMGVFESAEVRPPLEPADAQRAELLRIALEAVTDAALR